MMIVDSILHGDCMTLLPAVQSETVQLVIFDPPYNIGFGYGDEYDDSLPPEEYAENCRRWLQQLYRVLSSTGSCWVVIGDEWAAEMKGLAQQQGFKLRSWVIWYYTFGVNCKNKLTRSHAHVLYFVKHQTQFTFNADQIRVPSARALVYNDPRANPDGRLPDDTWIIRPQDLPEGFDAGSDTWTISRVNGTFKERQAGAANQLPEQLVGRIIRACSNAGDTVLDCMCGTGTVPAVAKKLGRRYLACEQSQRFHLLATQRVQAVKVGDPLDGPIPQGG